MRPRLKGEGDQFGGGESTVPPRMSLIVTMERKREIQRCDVQFMGGRIEICLRALGYASLVLCACCFAFAVAAVAWERKKKDCWFDGGGAVAVHILGVSGFWT
jgi:hypothetical protein